MSVLPRAALFCRSWYHETVRTTPGTVSPSKGLSKGEDTSRMGLLRHKLPRIADCYQCGCCVSLTSHHGIVIISPRCKQRLRFPCHPVTVRTLMSVPMLGGFFKRKTLGDAHKSTISVLGWTLEVGTSRISATLTTVGQQE